MKNTAVIVPAFKATQKLLLMVAGHLDTCYPILRGGLLWNDKT